MACPLVLAVTVPSAFPGRLAFGPSGGDRRAMSDVPGGRAELRSLIQAHVAVGTFPPREPRFRSWRRMTE